MKLFEERPEGPKSVEKHRQISCFGYLSICCFKTCKQWQLCVILGLSWCSLVSLASCWASTESVWSHLRPLLVHRGVPSDGTWGVLGSILGLSWVCFRSSWTCLGSSWAGLASFWAWVSSSWASSWALRAHLQTPRTLQKSSIFKMPPRCLKMALRWLKMAPRGLQDGSKILPRWVKAKWKSKTSSKVDVLQAPMGKVKYRSGSNSSSGRSR